MKHLILPAAIALTLAACNADEAPPAETSAEAEIATDAAYSDTSDATTAEHTGHYYGTGYSADSPPAAPGQDFTLTEGQYPFPEKQPNFGPAAGSIAFVDTDPGPTIGGTIEMGRAVDADGTLLDEAEEGISTYMIHWGLEVGEPGVDDNAGAGDHGGNCRGFRDTGHIVMSKAADMGDSETVTWEIPQGTTVPEGAVYFVGHTLYGEIHNLGKCTQTPIENLIE